MRRVLTGRLLQCLPLWLFVITLLSAIFSHGANAQVGSELSSNVSFHCSFDNTLEPDVHAGEGTVQESIWPFFVTGHRAAAYVIGFKRNARYALAGNLNPEQGTVAFWVMPLNWKSTDDAFHHFFRVLDESGQEAAPGETGIFSFLLYKFHDTNELFAYGMDNQLAASTMLRLPMMPEWIPGVWHHVAFCWDGDGAALYLDGQGHSMRYTRDAPRKVATAEFQIGGPYFGETLALTAMDDLYIFNRKLTADEVAALFRLQSH